MSAPAETGINEDLLRRVLEHITAHPEEHDQNDWAARGPRCGTAMCLAGHAVVLGGHALAWRRAGPTYPMPGVREVASETTEGLEVSELAQELLGLRPWEADRLFFDAQSLAHLWRIASELTDGRVSRPAAVPS